MFLLILVLVATQPNQAHTFFDQGHELQLQQDYDGALAAYAAAEASGWTSPELLLNMSAAAFSAGDLGRARLAAERAVLLSPRDPDIRHNLDLIRHATGELAPVPQYFLQSVRFTIERMIGRISLLTISWIIWIGFLTLAGLYLLGISRTDLVRRSSLILAPFVLFTLFMVIESHRDRLTPAAVTMTTTPIYQNAGEEHARITEISAGRILKIHRSEGDWREVRLTSGEIGWVPARVIEQV